MTRELFVTAILNDAPSIALFLGGLFGALLRAMMGQHPTLSRRTVIDILTGGLVAVAYQLVPILPLAKGATLAQYLAFGAVLGLIGSYVLTFMLWRLGVYKEQPSGGPLAPPLGGNGKEP